MPSRIKQGITNWVWFSSQFDSGKPQLGWTTSGLIWFVQTRLTPLNSEEESLEVEESLFGLDSVHSSSTELSLRESGYERIVNQFLFNSDLHHLIQVNCETCKLTFISFRLTQLNSEQEVWRINCRVKFSSNSEKEPWRITSWSELIRTSFILK